MPTNLEKSLRHYEPQETVQKVGRLGILIGGVKTVSVPDRPGFVYVRLLNETTEYVEAYNGVVAAEYDLPVKLEWGTMWYHVAGRDLDRYQDWGNSPFLPNHHHSHEFDLPNGGGSDTVWVRQQQFWPMLIMPSGTSSVFRLNHAYNYKGAWMYAGVTGTDDLTVMNPTDSSMQLLLVGTDAPTSNPQVITGSSVSAALFGNEAGLAPLWPTYPDTFIPHAGVALLSGTTAIQWQNLFDLRQFFIGGASLPTLSPSSVVITDSSGNITTDPQLTYNYAPNWLVVGSPSTGFPRLQFLTNDASIAGVINRGDVVAGSPLDLYFGETLDTGAFIFRGSGLFKIIGNGTTDTSMQYDPPGRTLTLGSEGEETDIVGPDATTADTDGATLGIYAGTGNGNGSGGEIYIAGGSAGSGIGQGGGVGLYGEYGGATGGSGGGINLQAGDAQAGDFDGAKIRFHVGAASGAGLPGYFDFVNGNLTIATGYHYQINGINLAYSDVGAAPAAESILSQRRGWFL